MHSLYFVHLTNVTDKDESLMCDMWKSLGGINMDSKVKAENVLTLLSATMNLNVAEIIIQYSDEESKKNIH